MAIIWSTGFETGTLSTIFDSTSGGEIQTTIKNSGSKAHYAVYTYEHQHNLSTPSVVVGRFYIYFHTFPADKSLIADMYGSNYTNPRIWIDPADDKLSFELGTSNKSIALSVDTWYRVEFKYSGTGTAHTFDGKVAVGEGTGTSITQCSDPQAGADTITYIRYSNTSDAEIYLDDLAISVTGTDYPLGPLSGPTATNIVWNII